MNGSPPTGSQQQPVCRHPGYHQRVRERGGSDSGHLQTRIPKSKSLPETCLRFLVLPSILTACSTALNVPQAAQTTMSKQNLSSFPHIPWSFLWAYLRKEHLVTTLDLAHILSFMPLKCLPALPASLNLYSTLLCESALSLMWTTSQQILTGLTTCSLFPSHLLSFGVSFPKCRSHHWLSD